MIEILNKYCNKESGLLLFNPPTGSGKTHHILNWIYSNYKEFCKENKKIFFITNLKKNLPYEKLKTDFFIPNKELEAFEKNVIFLDSNADSLIKTFEATKGSIKESFINSDLYRQIESNIEKIRQYQTNPSLRDYVEKLKEELRIDLEPKFRRSIEKHLKESYANREERIKAIQLDKKLQWIGKLYPAVFTSKKKIIFLSIDKFYYKNSTIVEPSYSFLENDITKNAIIFIDEFDATKDNILNNIIEKGVNQRIDFISLFNKIHWALSNKTLPQKFITHSEKREKLLKITPQISLENIHQKLLEKADEINNNYQLDYSLKTLNNEHEKANQRNLLFHDFQYHSIYRNNKKFIRLNTNDESKVNEIIFESERPQTGKNIVRLLNQIKGFISYFSIAIKNIATNYYELEEDERKNNPQRAQFTFDLALSTVIEEFRLEPKHKNYIIDNILSTRERPRRKTREFKYELNYDLSVYENGFRYYDFIDDDSHQSITKVFIYNFQNSPEKFLLKLSEKAKVIGSSATALTETVTGNYDIRYLKRQLGARFIELTDNEKVYLKELFDNQNKNYDKVEIHTEWVSFINDGNSHVPEKDAVRELEKLIEERELAQQIYGKLANLKSSLEGFCFNRYLKISYCFKQFLLKEDIKGFLCLLNREPKKDNIELNLEILNLIFEYLIKHTTKTENLFCSYDKKSKGKKFDVTNSYIIINSFDFENKKQSFITPLEKDEKIFIISMYQTMGAGQNLQFISPNPKSLINVQSEKTENWNTKNETDINAIYLDKPTHLIQFIDSKISEKEFIKYIFQLEFLAQHGYISIKDLNNLVANAFRYLLASSDTKVKLKPTKIPSLYNNDNINQHYAKIIIQAIGRICRTNLKSPNIYIYADEELDKYISDFDVENNLVLNEFRTLVQSCKAKKKDERDKDANLKNLADSTNQKVYIHLKKLIAPEWNWRKESKEEWESLREMCLHFPTASKNQIKEHNLNRIMDLYIELPEDNDKYYFSLKRKDSPNDFQYIKFDFEKNIGLTVSSSSARLHKLLEINGVEDFFKSKGWATTFQPNKYIIPPILFNNVYKGALGEQIGKHILETHLKIKLEELPLEHYELFDYKIKGSNHYIDFKHWKESTQINFDEQNKKIRKKLETVNGDMVYIINILSEKSTNAISSADGKIIEIPRLWDSEKQKFDYTFLQKFKENETL